MYWKFYHQKKSKISDKNSDIFHISAENIDVLFSWVEIRKNNVYPFKIQFFYIKVGFKGANII